MNIVKTFFNYCKACYEELAHKTTWPTRKELTQECSTCSFGFSYYCSSGMADGCYIQGSHEFNIYYLNVENRCLRLV